MLFLASSVCFIASHGGPADHFATFAENLSSQGKIIEIYASGPALKKFQERGVDVETSFSTEGISPEEENRLAEQIANKCSSSKVVVTDSAHPFAVKIQRALAGQASNVFRLAYYDNPEFYVPGGYSVVAAEVILEANGVLFANANLAKTSILQEPGKEIDFGSREKIGLGYYPIQRAVAIAKARDEKKLSMRREFFSKNNFNEKGQKVLVYFGGNNEEYFSKAFPFFLGLLEEGSEESDLSNLIVVIQQHPGAKNRNLDGNRAEVWMGKQRETNKAPRMILSDFSSDDAQIIADAALYYQTSMGPQFVLAGIPTVQIGHETFEDILVRNHLSPSVTSVDQFIDVVDGLTCSKKEIPKEVIFEGLGIKANWLETLEKAVNR